LYDAKDLDVRRVDEYNAWIASFVGPDILSIYLNGRPGSGRSQVAGLLHLGPVLCSPLFTMAPKKGTKAKTAKGKGKVKEVVASDEEMHEPVQDINVAPPKTPDVMDVDQRSEQVKEDSNASGAEGQATVTKSLTPQERVAKMAALREKMVSL
jgi:hypothetical protein